MDRKARCALLAVVVLIARLGRDRVRSYDLASYSRFPARFRIRRCRLLEGTHPIVRFITGLAFLAVGAMSGFEQTVDRVPADAEAEDENEEEEGDEGSGLRSTDPAVCRDHGLVHPEGRPWLPKQEDKDLAPHPYCTECGQVMGLGRAGGLDRGDLANLLGELERKLERAGHVVTDVQKRLIFQKIREDDIDDPFGFTRETQLALVSRIASRYLGIPEGVVGSYLE